MKTDDIRECFLEFFRKKGHKIISSDSLVPQNDPTLLFTGAGMNQFKEYFLGMKKDLKRAASCQKCLRTGDLDEVGKTPYHHSFFEMLGNFSFGDYFKEEAIVWAWEFLTQELKLSAQRLRVSVHQEDNKAFKIWSEKIKVKKDWIYRLGDESNFWPANAPKDGPNGPCGPCSEIYYDQNPESSSQHIEGDRFAEIWNLVFTQYDRQEGGKLLSLKQKNIDTGMGLERLACVLQKKKANFEIDIFTPISETIEQSLNVRVEEKNRRSLYAISDHLRAVVFSIADGVIPSNESRGYIVRKLIRRALWHAHELVPNRHLEKPFLYSSAGKVVEMMKTAYPELEEAIPSVRTTLLGEEKKFLETLELGLEILHEKMARFSGKKSKLPGEVVFELYDTYGFPDELTRRIASEKGLEIDQKEFEHLMEQQRKRAKQASRIATSIFTSTDLDQKLSVLPASKFTGYENLESRAKVLFADIQNRKGIIVLDQTPFYAESGGQVGDQGIVKVKNPKFEAKVKDTKKKGGVILHMVEVQSGNIKTGDGVECQVDPLRREGAMRNHTATHLLHAVLRKILGQQVRQLGSLVSPEKLRFDYAYGQSPTLEQLKQIEDIVNEQIMKDVDVTKEEKAFDVAKKDGAIAFFGEKYGEKVRVVTVPSFSKELCGGTHCSRTGQIGSFIITSDSSIGSGTRRIEALTGVEALNYIRTLKNQIIKMAQILKTTPTELPVRVEKLRETVRRLEKGGSIQEANRKNMSSLVDEIVSDANTAGAGRFAAFQTAELTVDQLRQLSDTLRAKAKETVYLLASKANEKIYYLLGMSTDLKKTGLDLTKLFSQLAPFLGASGGGRKDLVQGGGTNQDVLKEKNWNKVIEVAVQYLKNQGKGI